MKRRNFLKGLLAAPAVGAVVSRETVAEPVEKPFGPSQEEIDLGYITHCYFSVRDGDQPLFVIDDNRMRVQLDRYAVLPIEDLEKLTGRSINSIFKDQWPIA